MRALLQLRRKRKETKVMQEIKVDEVKLIYIMRTSSLPRQCEMEVKSSLKFK
jgi:hypothetical protein